MSVFGSEIFVLEITGVIYFALDAFISSVYRFDRINDTCVIDIGSDSDNH